MDNKQKILFVQALEEGGTEVESLWCSHVGDYYVIDNIPFIARRIALGDTIKAEYDSDEDAYYFDDFVAVSGNSTIRLFFTEEKYIEQARLDLNAFGCENELFYLRKIVAVNIPKECNYKPVKDYLDKGEADEKWVYEESCLSYEY
ncbi:DUF4265 domain-containing protein [Chitinophaga sp. 30R24]|uniref:DUF4265 domain-containing protein n=1 Tax=Chitinophaga sp. 30R24 TaxID=3248838 RepID=UPI003B905ADB